MVVGLISNVDSTVTDCFSMLFDKNLKELDQRIYSLNIDFIKSALSDEEQKRIERDNSRDITLQNFTIKKTIYTEDDGIVLLAEDCTYEYLPVGANGIRTIYSCGNIVAIKFDRSGNKTWEKVVKKNQSYIDGEFDFSSFYAYSTANGLGLIFNETEKDKLEEFTGESASLKANASFVSQVMIDLNGELKEKRLLNFENGELFGIQPMVCGASDNETIVLYARGKSVSALGKVAAW